MNRMSLPLAAVSLALALTVPGDAARHPEHPDLEKGQAALTAVLAQAALPKRVPRSKAALEKDKLAQSILCTADDTPGYACHGKQVGERCDPHSPTAYDGYCAYIGPNRQGYTGCRCIPLRR